MHRTWYVIALLAAVAAPPGAALGQGFAASPAAPAKDTLHLTLAEAELLGPLPL